MKNKKFTDIPSESTMRGVIITYASDICEGRYVICDAQTGCLIDNAQGYGFRSFERAENYARIQGWQVVGTNTDTTSNNPLF